MVNRIDMIVVDSREGMQCDFRTVQEAIDSLPEGEYLGVVIDVRGERLLEKPIDLGDRRGITIQNGVFTLQGEEEK